MTRNPDITGQLAISGFGDLYAWGYAANGRLGLGDIENEQLFHIGFDATRQVSYQYVTAPECVTSLFSKRIISIACGEEHSAAVTGNVTSSTGSMKVETCLVLCGMHCR